jgi:Mn2+/Fe2+ NRAMP family transporter
MGIYTLIIVAAAGVVLIPGAPLVNLMVLSAIVNGLMLPFVLVFIILLINNRKLMGEYVNTKSYNYISWGTVVAVAVLTALFVFASVFPIV